VGLKSSKSKTGGKNGKSKV